MSDGNHSINLDYQLINPKGEVLKDHAGNNLTARSVIEACLLHDNPNDPASATEKALAGKIAFTKLQVEKPTFAPEELALMKKRCGAGCTSMTWFQMESILNGHIDPLCS